MSRNTGLTTAGCCVAGRGRGAMSALRGRIPAILLIGMMGGVCAQPRLERVGVEGEPVELSLQKTLLMALEENPDLLISKARVEAEEMNLLSKTGAFDLRLSGDFSYLSNTVPVGSVLAGGPTGKVSTHDLSGTFTVGKNLAFGGFWSLSFESRRSTTSNVFSQLDPQFPSRLNLSWELPLGKNLFIDSNRLQIRVASKNVERSQAELRQQVLDTVTAVRIAYWSLVQARETVRVQQEAVELARAQLGRNQRLLKAGQAAKVDVIEAEAEVARRQENFLSSLETVTGTENQLKQLILGSRGADLWNRELHPLDREEQGLREVELSQAWSIARANRPELEVLRTREEIQRTQTQYFSDQTKPDIDLVASYGINGLAGEERTQGNPFSIQNALLASRVNALSALAQLPPLPVAPPSTLPDRLLGDLGRSLGTLFSNDFRTAQIGVRINLPVFNRKARGELGVSRARERELKATRVSLEQAIEAQTRNALQAVRTAHQRVEAARSARRAGKAKLESETRLFQAGETTNFLVLTRQNEYTLSRGREVEAEMDLNKAIANLQRTLGNATQSFHIQIQP
ncbi:MAG: TolC family protein [Acidobacteriota bacterium]